MTRLRVALIALGLVGAGLLGRFIDVRNLSGDIKGDEATYIAMALSLAEDGDLTYRQEDYQRFVRLYGEGPSGIFLKRRYDLGLGTKTPIPTSEGLAFAKALVYPAAAAPFAKLGGLGGLVVFNWVLLALCTWCGMVFAKAATRRRAGQWIGLAFVVASVTPIYAAWLTSEIFNFALIFLAYFLWLYKKVAPPNERTWLTGSWTTFVAAALIGMATFSKITHLALVGPLLLEAALDWRVLRTLLIGLSFAGATGGLFGINALITGEANFQGAEDATSRRSFYDAYPFDERGTTFEVGNAMVTNDADTERVLGEDILAQVPINTGYFFVGRHAGLIPFYFPGVVIAVVWAFGARRAPVWQWTSALAVVGSIGALILLLPDSWNGGGGPPGNRYFLSLYPPLLFLLRPGLGAWPAVVSGVGGLAFVGAMLVSPYEASAATWRNVERPPLRWLPIEYTLLLDLPVRLNPRRGGILFVREPTVLVYYMDGNTYDAEGQGFWIRGGETAETIVRSERPFKRVDLVFSAPIDNHVRGTFAGRPFDVTVRAGVPTRVQIARPEGFRYHQSYAHLLRSTPETGFIPAERKPGSRDTRYLGVFIELTFEYDEAE